MVNTIGDIPPGVGQWLAHRRCSGDTLDADGGRFQREVVDSMGAATPSRKDDDPERLCRRYFDMGGEGVYEEDSLDYTGF